ncbi:DNA-binding transcriptional regulator, MerR family [Streptoalloteichus tenebrarius]|uniref:DNA-binding transcriptional regulator, MerR family n=1 Tax=Streptoalloteichus tenebrarius (strain ATCC 17920 / DSM 40477 / JCM 4838 / CBS 697.72 / NBRC 16177 / NCIMB 11028 / NRRL B-12390 / A12253. 1 / ISP 5477) TaxID=1933 RepID=A0ABT1I095_STRSD|nr:MerR family transcriptional regulator [Streptoalloteichus tenebrarius]MCP2261173.1 DNA-binding transcriptional regulator, MerR family [Streptoalloteichus tenebrarius]BFF02969.1 MerR family transcriptional regulator [Streptoalloteichus tenebrarius]
MDELIGIGDLAARTGLSHKALRLYGARGLLVPAHVDPRGGARYYGPEQVERARRIALLRGIGMPLSEIGAVLALDGAEADEAVSAYWRRVEAEHSARSALVPYVRRVLSGQEDDTHVVRQRDVPEQKVAHVQRHVSADELPAFLREATEELFTHLTAAGARLSGPVFAIYHGTVSEDSPALVEVCAPTGDAVTPAGRVGVRFEPGHREAYVELTRSQAGYPAVVSAFDTVAAWLARHDLRPSASAREIYYPDWADAAATGRVVDVAWPFHRPATRHEDPPRAERA